MKFGQRPVAQLSNTLAVSNAFKIRIYNINNLGYPSVMQEAEARHYFVDEAGDLTLFNKRGKVIVGDEGCSKYFILGTALVERPHELRQKLAGLRQEILNDKYLQKIPSLKKTAISFHAKDDCPEVRMQVYKLLQSWPIKVYAIIRRKNFLVQEVHRNNQFDPSWRYDENKVYDSCVKRLFKDRLHLSPTNYVTFATRGKSARNEALALALSKAKGNFEKTSGKVIHSENKIISNTPSHEPVLQAIDYFLWAIQRLFEKHEDRHFNFVQDKMRRIIDLDDKRFKDYGVYYDERNLLTVDKIKNSL